MTKEMQPNGDNVVLLKNGQVWECHPKSVCANNTTPCVFHSPTEHHMDTWPLQTRHDRAFVYDAENPDDYYPTKGTYLILLERRCEHGVGHPDPNCVEWLNSVYPANSWGVHGCCGECGTQTIANPDRTKIE